MQDLPLRNIFLPATLVASTFFSVLTLPAILFQSPNDMLAWLPLSKRPSQIDLAYVHKEVMIPYIGTTIILSAGAGVFTAEFVRKRLSAQHAAASEAEATPAPQEVTDSGFLSLSGEDVSSLMPALPLTDAAFKWPTSEPAETTVSSQTSLLSEILPTNLPRGSASDALPQGEDAQTAQAADHKIVIFPGQYHRCRIQLPHLQEQEYAIEFNDRFYSLLIAGISKDEALAAVEELNKEDRTAIVTPTNQGHAVWVLEPAAQRVAVA